MRVNGAIAALLISPRLFKLYIPISKGIPSKKGSLLYQCMQFQWPTCMQPERIPYPKHILSIPFPTYFIIVSRCCTYNCRCFCVLLSCHLLESGSDPAYALTCPQEGLRLWPDTHLCLTVFKLRPLSSWAPV